MRAIWNCLRARLLTTLITDIPEQMRRCGREPVADFEPDENLYRRFSSDSLDGSTVAMDAIVMPDMSTMRQRFTDDVEWVLIDTTRREDFSSWGILAFSVGDIPEQIEDVGAFEYNFAAVHTPQRNNYPHTDVRAFLAGRPVETELSPDVHLRFRLRLSFKIRVIKQPST